MTGVQTCALPIYVEIGGVVGADVLNMPTAVWGGMTLAQQQAAMSAWVNSAIQAGSQIVFTNNPALAAAGTGLAYEYQYITKTLELQVVASGTSWIVVP